MKRVKLRSVLLLGIILALAGNRANALPGQVTQEVTAWINANPTLKPAIGDGLLVQRSNSPAQRLTFQATVLPPGKVNVSPDRVTVRTETISLFDMVNGVTRDRLQEALRVVYGLDIYQDYQRASVVYTYPSPQVLDQSRRENRPLLAAQQGELRLGDRYAYWVEVTKTESGKAFNGQVTVFLPEYMDKMKTELSDR